VKPSLILLSLAAAAAPAAAQVGTLPNQSPYRDVAYSQEFTVVGGWFGGSQGTAGIGPRAAPLFGVRYAIKLGGPVDFTAEVMRAQSTRLVLNPDATGAARRVGTTSSPLYLGDVGLAINLTGQKTWHHLMPAVSLGFGVASDAGAKMDVGNFKLGTPFQLTFGAGVRYIGRGPWSVRVDLADHFYRIHYPASYFIAPSGGKAILTSSTGDAQWLHNAVLTVGLSYLVLR
jgi:hypothetical protein